MNDKLEVTVLLPCLNEAETLAVCVTKARRSLEELGVAGEVLVSDNGSTDGSQRIAEEHGARVVHAPIKGYGGALLAGIKAARGRYVIMADADDSYDLSNLGPFVEGLRKGHDVVMGNRFRGGIAPGAMPPLHRYLGNPVLSWLGRVLFGLRSVRDFHCGIRGFNRERVLALGLCMPGMEFASELVVRAALAGYDIVEVPTTLQPDGRSRPPHLRTWRDGWRHLRFLLMFAPGKTLIAPGTILLVLGLVGTVALTRGPVTVAGVRFDIAALVYASLLVLVAVQLLLFGACAKIYGRSSGILRDDNSPLWLSLMRFEVMLGAGLALIAAGLVGTVGAVSWWGSRGFADLEPQTIIRIVMPSATAIGVGVVSLFSGLLTSLLALRGVGRPSPQDRGAVRDVATAEETELAKSV
ncbi:glycosyltransferase family 2 protein [Streptoalloteichus hindustanus]|uniref:Glycosyltransferase involved in cell wall bisynthesis n=1 Tax=Streptoalloteichus hindustanus TaxID=2017 RepID=A0A1M5KS77_STRHI|nr:glycosyltransferase family 2 protein [Streptoalloteichus hindustanus]SHG55576.1 Glycosyltransferase involved in cell wall bisynthesis [Streptoalloteichus hindustanus]